jgi:two-component system, cell cycle sensor histidine kinase and response regulator CckA
MNTATPFPWPGLSPAENAGAAFRSFFENAPLAVARCNSDGVIVEMNPAFQRGLSPRDANKTLLPFCELLCPQDRDQTASLLRDVLDSRRNAFVVEAAVTSLGEARAKWTAWRQTGLAGEPDRALLISEQAAEPANDEVLPGESSLQAHRWEAIGRLTGGVVHDFNNLLTGVMLYCDLLLSTLDGRDHRRRYADEIRSAIVQASGLVHQLLLCARPQAIAPGFVSLNEIAAAMRDLLTRLIGDNIVLELLLDPELGAIKIARAQAEQIVLNLVLNARDALPVGGRITVETSNCEFHPVAGMLSPSFLPGFPCVLLTVADNGLGMNAETRQHLFEPFFSTKPASEASGLGLTTVRGIVTTNHGMIHFESEPGKGTRAMVFFPRSAEFVDPEPLDSADPASAITPRTSFQEVKKESIL